MVFIRPLSPRCCYRKACHQGVVSGESHSMQSQGCKEDDHRHPKQSSHDFPLTISQE